ncbi:MAG: hypothetical protein ABL897_13625 [Hyphomicrobium sp.]
MVRKSVRVSGRLALSAALSWTLIPIAIADAPPAADQSGGNVGTDTAVKQLHTIPEDGIGDNKWLSGATRAVREIMAKRPKEDLIICVAGCVETQDRVVYAQPTEAVDVLNAETISNVAPKIAPAAMPAQADAAKPDDAKDAVKVSEPVTPAMVNPAPAAAVTPAAPPASQAETQPAIAPAARTSTDENSVPQFVPSAAQPNADEAPASDETNPEAVESETKAEGENSETPAESNGEGASDTPSEPQ